ncbi:Ran-binding protein 9 [Toxocara canis]|uniref:Ran-binding protein 9 n=1 Tax=Toxocara canis TaxID=6265 RepID=A0A0B2V0U2_TOXCA|nr:Ran-binding protein 9 [Toxocara canis]
MLFFCTAISNLSNVIDLYPMIGLQKHGEILETNFGQKPFKYNIEQDLQEAIAYTYDCIYSVELPQAKTSWMNHAIAAWLAHEGYSRALNAFYKATQHKSNDIQPAEVHPREQAESMENRRALQKLVLEGKMGEAICRIEKLYPSLLSRNKELALMLKCQQFVEILIELTEASNGASNSSSGSARPQTSTPHASSKPNRASSKRTPISNSCSGADQVVPSSLKELSVLRLIAKCQENHYLGEERSSQSCYLGLGDWLKPNMQQSRRASARISQTSTPHGRFTPSSFAHRSASNGNSLVASSDEPMDEDCPLPRDVHGLVSSNGTAHESNGVSIAKSNGSAAEANGASHGHVSATTIVAEELEDSLGECAHEEDAGEECRSAGYTKAELAPYERMQRLLDFGKSVNALSMELVHPPEALINRMHDAFALICQASPRHSQMGYLMDPSMRDKAATAMNSAILEFLGCPAQSLLDRHFHTAREMRHELALMQVGAAVFADVDKMVLSDQLLHR